MEGSVLMDPEKAGETIGGLYKLKEIYRVQGENVCWVAKDLIATLRVLKGLPEWVDDDTQKRVVDEKVKKLEDAINMFES